MASLPGGLADEKSNCWSRSGIDEENEQVRRHPHVGDMHIRVRPTASPFGTEIGNDREVRWLHRPEDFVVVKGHGFT
jgi:hypothetical protein